MRKITLTLKLLSQSQVLDSNLSREDDIAQSDAAIRQRFIGSQRLMQMARKHPYHWSLSLYPDEHTLSIKRS